MDLLRRGRRRAGLALGGLSLAVIAAIVLTAGHRTGVVPVSQAAPALATTNVAAPVATEPHSIRCSLDSTPQDARIVRVDTGAILGKTPATIALPVGDQAVTFRFEKPGYRAATSKVIPDLDKALRIDLVAEAEPAPAAAPEPRPSVSSSRRALARQGGSRKKAGRSTEAKATTGAKNSAQEVRSATPVNPFDM